MIQQKETKINLDESKNYKFKNIMEKSVDSLEYSQKNILPNSRRITS